MKYSKVRIQGSKIEETDDRIDRSLIEIDTENHFALSNLRGENDHSMIDYDPDLIVNFTFDDDTEWIGSIEDIKEVIPLDFLENNRFRSSSDGSDILYIPAELAVQDQRGNGLFNRIFKKIGFIKLKDKNVDKLVLKIAQKIDKKICPKKGLLKVNGENDFTPIDQIPPSDKPILLLFHGTISSLEKSYKGLLRNNAGLWTSLKEMYSDRIYAFQHYTLSESPTENTIQLLKKFPEKINLHLLSTSRGGLISDLLTRCQDLNSVKGFRATEIEKLKKEGEHSNAKALEEINQLILDREINIEKCIRIAAPAYGTDLLSKRLDHFINGLLFVLGKAIGGEANPIYAALKSLLMQLVKSKSRPDALPGLHAMVPKTAFQALLNGKELDVSGTLYAVAGNAKVGGKFGHSVVTILSKLFFWKKNDFVVHTSSMSKGFVRRNGNFLAEVNSKEIDHFKYFDNSTTLSAIGAAFDASMENVNKHFVNTSLTNQDRGVFLGLGEYDFDNVKGKKPIAIVLPGIMGSHLAVNGNRIYIDLLNMAQGHFVSRLNANADHVEAVGAVRKYYRPLVRHLKNEGYECKVFSFDWRMSLKSAALELKKLVQSYQDKYNQPIKIIAHSMGGLVVRRWMLEDEASWNQFISIQSSRFVMLGTPWNGSHLIVELLTGDLNRLEMISQLDLVHSKKEVLETVNRFEGVYELLPVVKSESSDVINFDEKSFWQDLNNHTEVGKFPIPPKKMLDQFKAYKTKANQQSVNSAKNIYYIAGTDDQTTFAFEKAENHYYKYIEYKKTIMGDGSVTWELGIPNWLPENQVFYTQTTHMNLAKDKDNFRGITDLLEGTTSSYLASNYDLNSAVVRGASGEVRDLDTRPYSEDFLDRFFDIRETPSVFTDSEEFAELKVSVSHGDLLFCDYPVMTGHFRGDGIISAEGALNRALDGALEERKRISGNYPEDIGKNLIIFGKKGRFKGGIVVGMGDNENLTAFQLRKTVEQAIIDYSFIQRDNSDGQKIPFKGISTVCISSGYGELGVEESLYAIIHGVSNANAKIKEHDNGLPLIRHLEVIELYEDIAREIFYALQRIKEKNQRFNLSIERPIRSKFGGLVRLRLDEGKYWWHHFTTRLKTSYELMDGGIKSGEKLVFTSSTGRARVEEETNLTPDEIIDYLLSEMSKSYQWNKELSKTLFEMVIPNGFKAIIRNHSNILWKLDATAASIPWEMFHDSSTDERPTFTDAGLIRQFIERDADYNRPIVRTNSALVIGDPIYDDLNLGQLPNARLEAELVGDMLSRYQLKKLIRKGPLDIFNTLFNTQYKILHFAGHGVYDVENDDAGIVVGNMRINSALINQLPHIPEFVFINCCQSGELDPKYDEYFRNRYKFASNIGHQFIKMGVEAVVVTGWAVADAAAMVFAQVFYAAMLDGYHFGDAVKMARKSCYDKYGNTNTWGAYQCYGDPWYKFDPKKSKKSVEDSYITLDEALVDLHNELKKSYQAKESNLSIIEGKIDRIIRKTEESGFRYDAEVIEKEAEIYRSLNDVDRALERYQELLRTNKASYRVSALEQYCNLLVKEAVLRSKKTKISAEETDRLEKTVNTLLEIGRTQDRYNIIGSMYKKMCLIRKRYKSDLTKMADNYGRSFEMAHIDGPVQYAYPLVGMLEAKFFLEGKNNKQFFLDRVLKATTIITRVKKLLKTKKLEYQIFWEDIPYIQLISCELLYSTSKNDIEELKNEILNKYVEAWSKGGEYHHLMSEIEHFEFLHSMASVKSASVEQPNVHVRNALKEILDGLIKLKSTQ